MTHRSAFAWLANANAAVGCFFCCAVIVFFISAAEGDPASIGQQTILRGSDYTLATVRAPGRYALLLRNAAGQTHEITMPDTPWNVAFAAPATDGKVVVDLPAKDGGGPAFGSNTVFILGSKPPALLDQLLCETPVLSPDGKFLSFLAWYPPHFAPEPSTSNFVMIYDLTQPVLANRNAPRTDFPLGDLPDRRVGVQVYPVSRRPVGRRDATASAALPMHEVYDLTWSPDSRHLLFLDEVNSSAPDDAGPAIKAAARANRRSVSETEIRGRPLLILVDRQGRAFTVRRALLQTCPEAAEIRCEFDLHAAIFGSDGVVVTQHLQGRTNKDLRVYVDYSSFQIVQ